MLVGSAVAAAALVLVASASAAAPRYVMVTGPGLARPVLLDDWSENLQLMGAIAYGDPVRAAQLVRRPRFLVSLFWNANVWTEPPTGPKGANQRGWFYPAYGERRAAFELLRSYGWLGARRRANSQLLAILARHGVPTRCAFKPGTPRLCSRATAAP